jgi:very-short-patch-repair endonuclease
MNKFESYAEEKAYPFIKEIVDFYEYTLTINKSIRDWDYCDWVKEKELEDKAEELEEQGYRTTYHFEKYRLDFALESPLKKNTPFIKVDIEIDGEEFHITKRDHFYDLDRNEYLEKKGWHILRIKAQDVFTGKIKEILEKEFLIGQIGLNNY